jgi:OOP family OmpA-OmpF porin
MKSRTALLLFLASFLLLISAAAAHAEDDRQVWRDSDGMIVHNSWGTCVRGNWIVDHDPCAPQVVEYVQPPPPMRTVIAEADRTVYFAFDKTDLTPESQQKLSTLAGELNAADDIQGAKIVGYADRIGTTSYNEALSEKRAEAVRAYMIEHGLLKPAGTETRWVGKSESNTACPANLTHEQMVECLAPDRKVTVDVQYRLQKMGP